MSTTTKEITAPEAAKEVVKTGEAPKNQKITTQVLNQIEQLRQKGSITLPDDYDYGNALNSAWLHLQTVQGKDLRSVIANGQVNTAVVTLSSVANALHDMCIQGLNVAKKQCYFIVYGDQLLMQRSYFGDMHVASTVCPGLNFYWDAIYKGEVCVPKKIRNKLGQFVLTIESHEQTFPRASNEVVGAYFGITKVDPATGEVIDLGCVLMDMDRIKKSWEMSKTYKNSTKEKPSTHDKYPAEMAIRTVARKACTPIINTSNDAALLASVRRQEEDSILAEANDLADENANKETLSLPPKSEPVTLDPIGAADAEPQEAELEGF